MGELHEQGKRIINRQFNKTHLGRFEHRAQPDYYLPRFYSLRNEREQKQSETPLPPRLVAIALALENRIPVRQFARDLDLEKIASSQRVTVTAAPQEVQTRRQTRNSKQIQLTYEDAYPDPFVADSNITD